jgi:hypothetical protein
VFDTSTSSWAHDREGLAVFASSEKIAGLCRMHYEKVLTSKTQYMRGKAGFIHIQTIFFVEAEDHVFGELKQILPLLVDSAVADHRRDGGASEACAMFYLAVRLVSGRITHPVEETPHLPPAQDLLSVIDGMYAELREQTRRAVQQLLSENAGKDFPSLEEKQAFATRIRDLLRRADLRIKCPRCGEPAILRASAAGNSRYGVFHFDHPVAGARSSHRGSTKFPENLFVIDAPVDRRVTPTSSGK